MFPLVRTAFAAGSPDWTRTSIDSAPSDHEVLKERVPCGSRHDNGSMRATPPITQTTTGGQEGLVEPYLAKTFRKILPIKARVARKDPPVLPLAWAIANDYTLQTRKIGILLLNQFV